LCVHPMHIQYNIAQVFSYYCHTSRSKYPLLISHWTGSSHACSSVLV
jgi:hypothetical protein